MAIVCEGDKHFNSSMAGWGVLSLAISIASLALTIYSIRQNKVIIYKVTPEPEIDQT